MFSHKKTGRMFRKGMNLLLSVLLTVPMIPLLPAAAGTGFQDVSETDWFYKPVMYVNEKGLMKGTSDHTFEPELIMSRAMLVTVLYRMEGEPEAAASTFGDIGRDSWFSDAVDWAAAEGIVKGRSESVFDPFSPVTREQIAAIMYRYADTKSYDVSGHSELSAYTDADAVSGWAESALSWAVAAGLVNGFEDRTLAPQKEAGRGQAAAILQRFCEKVQEPPVDDPGGDPDENAGLSFTDSLIRQMPEDKNWTVSPYSLEMCLAMVANGTKGKSQEELLKAMQIDDLESYNENVRKTLETYESYQDVMSLETSNSVWINQDHFQGKGAFLGSFSDLLKLDYRAETGQVWDRNSVETINAWADEKTHGKITQILNEDHRRFAAALANAVYFKAAWMNPFFAGATAPDTFYNQDGSASQVPFMNQLESLPYYEEEGLRIVEMPYKNYVADEKGWSIEKVYSDADFGMYLLMGDEAMDLQNVLDHASFRTKRVRLRVPKFKVEYGDSLVEELKALGVLSVFDPARADLSGMIDYSQYPWIESLYLDEVMQKTFLSIDEEGTEAAAVTVALSAETAVPSPDICEFTADHPFYYVIRDNSSGRILFAGKYNQAEG